MVSSEFFDKLSRIVGAAHNAPSTEPFGGLSIILCGDFHQFPPVGGSALYWPNSQQHGNLARRNGRALYEQFETVVCLKTQVRAAGDPTWRDFLGRLRDGRCNTTDRNMIADLNLRSSACDTKEMQSDEWRDAVLVTPRHSVRRRWNAAALCQHCKETGRRLYRCRPYSTIDGERLNVRDEFRLASENARRKTGGVTKNLDETLELSVGMKVMMTYNVQTELELANGARGEVVDIVLNANEPPIPSNAREATLSFPPTYVLVRFEIDGNKTGGLGDLTLPGLERGIVRMVPRVFTQTLNFDGIKRSVKRDQLPLTPAYAFTDYRAQGQTIPRLLIDLGKPGSGAITPFNTCVACSRAQGRAGVRFVRDVDWAQFTSHPSEFLRNADERLMELDRRTKERCQSHAK